MKIKLGLSLLLTSLLLGACGQDEAKPAGENSETKSPTTEQQNEEVKLADSNTADERLQEVAEDTVCAFCNMEVYEPTHELGAYSAQGIQKDGSTLFFDDVGCMLNQERHEGVALEKFVRDNNSKEWITLEDAFIVKADIKTPMNYGYAFFKDQNSNDAFVKDNEGAKVAAISEIDEVSKVRYEKRMEKMNNGDSSKDGHTDSSGHNN